MGLLKEKWKSLPEPLRYVLTVVALLVAFNLVMLSAMVLRRIFNP